MPSETTHRTYDLPIDRGWAWVVLFAAALEHFLVVGTIRSFGIYFVEFLVIFDTDVSTMAAVLAVQTAAFSVFSLMTLTVGEQFDANRHFVMLGGFFVGLSYVINSVATGPGILALSIGVLYGGGAGFCHGPAIVGMQKYFNKRRGMANVVMALGGSLGGFVLPYFMRYLLDTYGLSGALLVWSGCLFHIMLAGAVLRPIKWFMRSKSRKHHAINTEKELQKQLLPDILRTDGIKQNGIHRPKAKEMFHNNNVNILGRSLEVISKSSSEYRKTGIQDANVEHKYRRRRTVSDTVTGESLVIKDANKNDNNYHISVSSLYSNGWVSFVNIPKTDEAESSFQESDESGEEKSFIEILKTLTLHNIWSSIIDKNVLLNRLFLLSILASSFGISGCALVNLYLPPHARDMGISDQNIALMLSILGGMDLANKVLLAFLSDRQRLRPHHLAGISTIIAGATCFLLPFYTNFWSLALFAAINGLFSGTYFALSAVILVDFIGIQNLSKALACTIVMHGVVIAAINPILGVIRDYLGTYLVPFYLMGGGMVLSGILFLCEPLARKLEKRRMTRNEDFEDTIDQA